MSTRSSAAPSSGTCTESQSRESGGVHPLSRRLRTEAVRPVPVEKSCVHIKRDIDTGTEPGELPGPVREGAQSEMGRPIKCATADRPVAAPDDEDDVTVQHALRNTRPRRRNTSRLDRKSARLNSSHANI